MVHVSLSLHEPLLQVSKVALPGLQTHHAGYHRDVHYPYLSPGLPHHFRRVMEVVHDSLRHIIEEAVLPEKAVGDRVVGSSKLDLSRIRGPDVHH